MNGLVLGNGFYFTNHPDSYSGGLVFTASTALHGDGPKPIAKFELTIVARAL